MFIRPDFRTFGGQRRAYWALVESYRSERGPRQRIVAWLGQLDEDGRLGGKQAALKQVNRNGNSIKGLNLKTTANSRWFPNIKVTLAQESAQKVIRPRIKASE